MEAVIDTTQTQTSAVELYNCLFDHGLATPFAPDAEPTFSQALEALFERADSDESLRPLVVAVQDAGWAFATAAHDSGLTFGAQVVKGGLIS